MRDYPINQNPYIYFTYAVVRASFEPGCMPLPENQFSISDSIAKILKSQHGCVTLLVFGAPIVLLVGYLIKLLSVELVAYIPYPLHITVLIFGIILSLVSALGNAIVYLAADNSVHISSPLWAYLSKGLGRIFLFFELMVLFAAYGIGDDWVENLFVYLMICLFLIVVVDAVWRLRTDTHDKIVIGDNEVVIDLPFKKSQLKLERNQVIEIRTHHRWSRMGKDYFITFKYSIPGGTDANSDQYRLEPAYDLNVRRSVILKVLQAKGYTVTEA